MNERQENLRQRLFELWASCDEDKVWKQHLLTYDSLIAEINSLRRKVKRYETTDELKPRTEKVWKNYLDRIHNVGLNDIARDWGMGSINGKSKSERIDLMIIHLDVMEKVIK